MKLTQEQMNAAQAQARRCTADIKAAMRVKPKPSWNQVVPPILRRHHEVIKPMGIDLVRFISIIGRQSGRFGVDSE
ncbi:hypothetical protein [Pluralibacter gergoviae]